MTELEAPNVNIGVAGPSLKKNAYFHLYKDRALG
jgi:hypothetical protein